MAPPPAPSEADPAAPTVERPPLRRPREGRIVAGVAAGLSDHLGIDVAIVRILLVVSTILTSGLVLLAYLAAWVLIPAAEPGAPRPTPGPRSGEAGSSRDPVFWLGVGLLVVGALWLLGGPLSGIGFIGPGALRDLAVPLVLIAFGLALWRAGERRVPPGPPSASSLTPPPPAPTTPAPATPAPTTPAPAAGATTPPTSPPDEDTTTEIDVSADTTTRPLGPTVTGDEPTGDQPTQPMTRPTDERPVDRPTGTGTALSDGGENPPPPPGTGEPFEEPAWTPPPAPERRRSLLTRVTLGVALVTAGVLWLLRGTGALGIGWGQIGAATLLVIGLGLLVGSRFGRGRWLILAGGLLLPVVLAWQVVAPWAGDFAPGTWATMVENRSAGELIETPPSLEHLQPVYELGAGSIRLDLTELDLDGETATTEVRVGAGEIRIEVPDDAEVDVTARSGIGEIDLLGRDRVGGIAPGERTSTHEPDGPAQGRIELELSAGLGEVRVDLVPAD